MAQEEKAVETDVKEEENEPIYYKPSTLSLIATIASWGSWVVLVAFILAIIGQANYLNEAAKQGGMTLIDVLKNPQAASFAYGNILVPLFSALSFFVLLQAASIGLNALLEIDFNLREPQN